MAAFPEGHPEAATLDDDAKVLRTKQDAGADFAVTQFFFSTSDYFDLVGRARQMGAELPIIPGIMPVTSVRQIERFADLSGAAFPPELAARFHEVADDSQAVIDLGWRSPPRCQELLDGGAPGLHFYTSTADLDAAGVPRAGARAALTPAWRGRTAPAGGRLPTSRIRW